MSDFVGVANRPASHAHSAARHLIPWVWREDPLGCPVCQNPMRVIAAIDDPASSGENPTPPGSLARRKTLD